MEEEASIVQKPLRLNWHYILWYRNVFLLIVSLIIPIILLAYWNSNIVLAMIRRQRLKLRPSFPVLSPNEMELTENLLNPANTNDSSPLNTNAASLQTLNTEEINMQISMQQSKFDQGKEML